MTRSIDEDARFIHCTFQMHQPLETFAPTVLTQGGFTNSDLAARAVCLPIAPESVTNGAAVQLSDGTGEAVGIHRCRIAGYSPLNAWRLKGTSSKYLLRMDRQA